MKNNISNNELINEIRALRSEIEDLRSKSFAARSRKAGNWILSKKKIIGKVFGVVAAIFIMSNLVIYALPIASLNTFTTGTVISSTNVNQNFETLRTAINTNYNSIVGLQNRWTESDEFLMRTDGGLCLGTEPISGNVFRIRSTANPSSTNEIQIELNSANTRTGFLFKEDNDQADVFDFISGGNVHFMMDNAGKLAYGNQAPVDRVHFTLSNRNIYLGDSSDTPYIMLEDSTGTDHYVYINGSGNLTNTTTKP